MKLQMACVVGLFLVGGEVFAQDVAPLGGQFQINTYTTNQQYKAAVATDAQGDFVVVWGSLGGAGTDLTGWSIQAQRYDANGTPKDLEFQVNSYTTSSQEEPAVAADALGNFVVAWEGKYQDDPTSSHSGILAQRYDSNGTPAGVEFQVNSYTTYSQIDSSVGSDADGNFVVAWSSYFPDGSQSSVQAQRYDDTGTLVGGEFQVNSYTTSHQKAPAVAFDGLGDFVVVWQSAGSYGTDKSQWSIQAQRFDATGVAVGDQFQVNSYTTSDQYRPSVGFDDRGAFIVVWESKGSADTDTSDFSVQGQFFDASGDPVGNQFQVNSYTNYKQRLASVSTIDAEGNFVVVWQSQGSYGTDSSNYSIQGQRFASRAILVDSFESGDLSAWSNVVQ